ncbi:redoxin family protein [Candidatus Woesearchaeota archaeon]|nr:redoxin family protein [Candidatus Woesearchaeota archaeon]
MKKSTYLLFMIILILTITGCNSKSQTNNELETQKEFVHWLDYELKDINSNETFKISDFKGKKVMMETFSVWCVNCKQQQNEIKKFNEQCLNECGEDVVFISINADPNEDEKIVKKHIEENEYSWRYVIAPSDFMNQLMNEFGFVILNAPQAPIVRICEDQSYTLIPTGVKTVEDLKEVIKMGC